MAKKKKSVGHSRVSDLSGHAKLLSEIGPQTAAVTLDLNQDFANTSLFAKNLKENPFLLLSESLQDWPDDEAARVLKAILGRLRERATVDFIALKRWTLAHKGDARAVIDCLV